MASFKKLSNGKVRAFVCINGHRASKTLSASKARSWAREREVALSKLVAIEDDSRTLGDLFTRYAKEVSPKKRGYKWELKRLYRFQADVQLSQVKLKDTSRQLFERWIERRLTEKVMPSTVNRELNLLSACLGSARHWRWMAHQPLKELRRPKDPAPRSRRISEEEIDRICHAAGFQEGQPLTQKRHFVAVAFLFAIETAMRAGEICGLTWEAIDLDTRVAHLDHTKNGDERDVPLTKRAIELLRLLPLVPDRRGRIFHLSSDSLSALFRRYRLAAGIDDLHFHDARHEATTRLARLPRMNVLRLAKITGHKNLKYLMVYFNETAEEMVETLDVRHDEPAKGNLDGDLFQAFIKKVADELRSEVRG